MQEDECFYEAKKSKAVETKVWVISSTEVSEFELFFFFLIANEKSNKKELCGLKKNYPEFLKDGFASLRCFSSKGWMVCLEFLNSLG